MIFGYLKLTNDTATFFDNDMKFNSFLLAAIFLSTAVFADDKIVTCEVKSLPDNGIIHKGKCKFVPEGGGSFALMHPRNDRYLFDRTFAISVAVVEKGVGQVFSSMADKAGGGHNSRWCEVKRSATDKACWVGDCVSICAW